MKDEKMQEFRNELKDLYIALEKLKQEDPEMYKTEIEALKDQVISVRRRIAQYLTIKYTENQEAGGRPR